MESCNWKGKLQTANIVDYGFCTNSLNYKSNKYNSIKFIANNGKNWDFVQCCDYYK